MPSLLSKSLTAIVLAAAAAALCAAGSANAAEQKPAAAKKAAKAKKKAAEQAPDATEADLADTTQVDYKCELGNTLTIYKKKDESQIALRWKKRLHLLTRVATTTGAIRFENPLQGLVWIGIPSKGILLDSRRGRQLANNCQSPEQASAAPAQASGLIKD